ncbi:hypothetical protein GCM10027049_11910 [Mucilaginibacter puniceus]
MVAFFCWCFLFLHIADSYAQAKQSAFIDSMINKIDRYGIKHHTPEMFVHFDKTVYSNNENVWLTAYLLDSTGINNHTTLIVSLIKDDARAVVLEDKFVMDKGLAFGNLFIPDSVTAGNYTFVAYTNLMLNGNPYILFKQPVTIKTANQATFTAQLSPVDTSITSAEMKVRLIANISAVDLLPNADVNYYVGSPANHLISGKVKTDASGQYVFSVPSKILSPGNNKIYVSVKHKGEEKEISMALPVASQLPVLNFYPEGGNLVNNLSGYVAWEAKTADNTPLQISAILYKDDKVVDTIETNGYGMGKFIFTPNSGSKYVVKLNGNMGKSYDLPAILTSGPAISTQRALVNDTLTITLQDNKPEKLFVLVHNYRQLFSATPIAMSGNSKRVKILLNEVPKGINQLTVTDSLGRPFAQRTFFAHYNRKQSLQIDVNDQFGTRQKVNIKVKLNNIDTSAMALVSIAAVQDNRIEIKRKNDIESYFYLNSQLGDLPVKENYLGSDEADKEFLENVLLIKGWARYKWTDVLKIKSASAVHQFEMPAFKGKVTTLANKPLKNPVTVMVMGDGRITPVQTDNTGNIVFENEHLFTMPEKKIRLMVSGDNPDIYKIQVTDPFSTIAEKIPALLAYNDYSTAAQQSTSNMELAGNEKAIQLNEVKINSKKIDVIDNSFFGLASRFGANECGDYVCEYNILNCPNHRGAPNNTQPVTGKTYQTPNRGGAVSYSGCIVPKKADVKNSVTFKGIYNTVEFYGSDYSEISPSQPEYISTIYWKHLEKITAGKETNFSFYTSDITGRFKIIIQGITDDDVVYGEKTFTVSKPK